VIEKDNERPDLAGIDTHNEEFLLCEAKFWAGLTANQPVAYLDRLRKNGDATHKSLVFICPKNRIISLWGELLRLCPQHDYQLEDELREPKYTKIDGLSMAIVSWTSVIDILRQALSTEHSPLLNDLTQLQGLCDLMDENSFLLFVQEDFGVDRARRITSYYNIVDRATVIIRL